MNKKEKGIQGEEIALSYLKEKGISIINKNFRCPFGEIDIIGLDQKKVIFYEVKYRKNNKFGDILDSINNNKIQKILKTAQYFLIEYKQYRNSPVQFDAIFINDQADKININLLENFVAVDNETNGVL